MLNIPSIYGGSNLWGDNPSQKKRKKAAKITKKEKEREPSSSSMSSMDLSFAIQGELVCVCVVVWVCFYSVWCELANSLANYSRVILYF